MQPHLFLFISAYLIVGTSAASIANATLNSHSNDVWFSALPEGSTPQIDNGVVDFFELFDHPSKWENTREYIRVFEFYDSWLVPNPPIPSESDNSEAHNLYHDALDENRRQLQTVVEFLQSNNIAIALNVNPLSSEANADNLDPCSISLPGFDTANSIRALSEFKKVGANVSYIVMNRPYYAATQSLAKSGCKPWTPDQVSEAIKNFNTLVKSRFYPDVVVGDSEPLKGNVSLSLVEQWMTSYSKINSSYPAFVHIDPAFSQSGIDTQLRTIQSYLTQNGINFGLIIQGQGNEPDSLSWMHSAEKAVASFESTPPKNNQFQRVFLSWKALPKNTADENNPTNLISLVEEYIRTHANSQASAP